MKKIIKSFLSSVLNFKNCYYKKYSHSDFEGSFSSLEKVKKESSGYDNKIIFEKTLNAALKVKNNEAVYERDSVIFDKVQYSWPLLSCLLYISSIKNNSLNILDFGGSLGTSYFQNRKYLSHLKSLNWNIVEQKHYVEAGIKYLEDEHLKFFYSIEESINYSQPNVILLSSVLQYLEKPYDILKKLMSLEIAFLIIDRTPLFVNNSIDRLTVQNVPETIYKASYPAWILSEDNIIKCLHHKYELLETFDSIGGKISLSNPDNQAEYRGLFFKLSNDEI